MVSESQRIGWVEIERLIKILAEKISKTSKVFLASILLVGVV